MLLSTNNTSVIYECANTLVALSSAPTAIKAAANCYCQLLVSQSDNNVKLIVLDRLGELQRNHRYVMQEMVMDILRAVNAPNSDIRRKALDIVLDLVTVRNVDEVVGVLKKELQKSQTDDGGANAGEYRQMLVQATHQCAVKFPETAGTVVHLLMDFLGDTNVAAAFDVAMFIREIAQTNEALRPGIVKRLLDCFYSVRSARVAGTCLWIIGEYSLLPTQVVDAFATLTESLGATPFYKKINANEHPDTQDEATNFSSPPKKKTQTGRPQVLADGSYATQTAVVEVVANGLNGGAGAPNLRALVLGGDFFLGSVVATTLTKLALRFLSVATTQAEAHRLRADVMLYIVCLLRLGKSHTLPTPIDEDSADRLSLCLKTLAAPSSLDPAVADVWLKGCRDAFKGLIDDKIKQQTHDAVDLDATPVAQADDLIDFFHLKSRKGLSQVEIEDAVATDLARATGFADAAASDKDRKLDRVLQLTGFSDPVYAEAYVTVHQYDIVMDVTVVNRSKEIQQNLCLELATMGDLKLVERPQVRVGAYTKSRLPVLPKLVTVQTDYGDCCPYIVQYTPNTLRLTSDPFFSQKQSLGIPYHVVNIVSGELNDAAAKKYDLEAWFPSSQTYRELVSCSNCTDFQSRRLEVRCGAPSKGPERKKAYVHLLNSTLTATERSLCCVIENWQTSEGLVVPPVLRPFMMNIKFVPFVKKLDKKGKLVDVVPPPAPLFTPDHDKAQAMKTAGEMIAEMNLGA